MAEEKNEQLNFDVDTIFVTMDDGKEQEFAILDEFDLDGKNYMILSPIEEDDTIGEDEYLYEYTEENDEIDLIEIEDDDEFERVSAYYESLMEEEMEGEGL